jgi:hypothetical protein
MPLTTYTAGEVLTASSLNANFTFAAANPSSAISIFNETQASGTQGGTATSGSYAKRVLNTTVTNNITGCSIASSVVTLATSGTYYLVGIAPGWRCGGFKLRLQNTTTPATIALGTSGGAGLADDYQDWTTVQGYVTTTTSTNIELQMQVSNTSASSGLGRAVTFGDSEIYAQLYILKVA